MLDCNQNQNTLASAKKKRKRKERKNLTELCIYYPASSQTAISTLASELIKTTNPLLMLPLSSNPLKIWRKISFKG